MSPAARAWGNLACLVTLWALGTLASYGIGSRVAHRRQEVEFQRMEGVGMDVAGLRRALPEGRDKALELYLRAEEMISKNEPCPTSSNDSWDEDTVPWPATWHARAEASGRQNVPALGLVRRATTQPITPWSTREVFDEYPLLNRCREVANVVGDESLRRAGEPGEAAGLIEDLDVLAERLLAGPEAVDLMVGAGISCMGHFRVVLMAGGITRESVADPESRRAVERLIARYLAPPPRRGIAEAMARSAFDGRQVLAAYFPGLLAPVGELEWCRALRLEPAVIGGAPTPAKPTGAWAQLVGQLVGQFDAGRMELMVGTADCGRQASALALAAALYRSDHGAYPETLETMVPGYLPRVPGDPSSRTGVPVRYRLVSATRPVAGFQGASGAPVDFRGVGAKFLTRIVPYADLAAMTRVGAPTTRAIP